MSAKQEGPIIPDGQRPNDFWQAYLDRELAIPPRVRDAWLRPLKCISLVNNKVMFEARDHFFRQWVLDHHSEFLVSFGMTYVQNGSTFEILVRGSTVINDLEPEHEKTLSFGDRIENRLEHFFAIASRLEARIESCSEMLEQLKSRSGR